MTRHGQNSCVEDMNTSTNTNAPLNWPMILSLGALALILSAILTQPSPEASKARSPTPSRSFRT